MKVTRACDLRNSGLKARMSGVNLEWKIIMVMEVKWKNKEKSMNSCVLRRSVEQHLADRERW